MKWMKAMVTLGICSSLWLTACSSEEGKSEHQSQAKETSNGDIHEETSSIKLKPEFLTNKPKDIQSVYLAVAQHQDLLENIPCYCGCAESVHHKNNYDCFIYENKASGAVTWDDHGTKCGVCLEIATQSIKEYNEGKA